MAEHWERRPPTSDDLAARSHDALEYAKGDEVTELDDRDIAGLMAAIYAVGHVIAREIGAVTAALKELRGGKEKEG